MPGCPSSLAGRCADADVARLPPVTSEPTRVLIAEDEALIRLDLKEMLEEEGYSVVAEVGDGQQAVDRARNCGRTWSSSTSRCRCSTGCRPPSRSPSARIAPVIVLTAFSQRELVERARDAGAMAYLVKPFSKNDLVPAIEVARARFAEMTALDGEVRTLEERLETRKVVEQAKGRLMEDQGMTEAEAFRWIQRTAMNQRTSMKALAQSILEPDAARPRRPPPEATPARGPARSGRSPCCRDVSASRPQVTTSSRSLRGRPHRPRAAVRFSAPIGCSDGGGPACRPPRGARYR